MVCCTSGNHPGLECVRNRFVPSLVIVGYERLVTLRHQTNVIVWRLYSIHLRSRASEAEVHGGSPLSRLAIILTESAALYTICQLLLMIYAYHKSESETPVTGLVSRLHSTRSKPSTNDLADAPSDGNLV